MQTGRRARRGAQAAFSLVELAVVLTIVTLLLSSLMYTLSAQVEQRNFEDTRRRLDQARELLLTFAIVNGRLPCPALCTDPPTCSAGGTEAPAYLGGTTGGACTSPYGGFLPGRTIGHQNVDTGGYVVDAWGNRIRYAVASLLESGTCVSTSTTPHFTNATNLKANGITCQPGDLLVCKSATGITGTACGGAANQIMTQNLVVAILYSIGKNGSTGGGAGADEQANLNGDRVFVWHTPAPYGAVNGEFDDQMTWITHGELYGRLISAGVLP
jgi:type II secretory pathway pseudopilin PulG